MATIASPDATSPPGLQTGLPDLAASNGDASRLGGSHDGPELLRTVAEGAHQTIDRLADQVAPHVQRLQDNMADATEMLDARADQIRETTDVWLEALRGRVRENPLAAVGAALAIGLVVARLSR